MGDDPKWLAWRRGDDLADGCAITASAIARAASGKYGGAYGVVAEHLGLVGKDQDDDGRMERGHAVEPLITTAAEAMTGLFIVGEQTLCQHPDHPEWRATLDGFAAPIAAPTIDDCTHVAEVKSRHERADAAWDYWSPQVQWQMLVTGLPAALLAEGTWSDEQQRIVAVAVHIVEADMFQQLALIDLAEFLIGHMRAGTTPEPDAASLDLVKRATATADPDLPDIDLTPMAHDVQRLHELKASVKADQEEAKGLEAKIRQAIGEATSGVAGGFTVNIAKPRAELTEAGATRFLAAHPECAKTVVDVDLAKKVAKKEYEAAREPVGARALTVKETE